MGLEKKNNGEFSSGNSLELAQFTLKCAWPTRRPTHKKEEKFNL